MGLIKVIGDMGGAAINSASAALHSGLWKEYFTSGDMSNGILMKRGERITSAGGKNKQTDDNLISSGSGIDVQAGQCVLLIDNGRIVEFCAEPGRYTFDASSAPSFFAGENKGLRAVFKEFKSQFSGGGQRMSTQRVYFINLGEIIYNPIKWGCGDIPFHHVQNYAGGTVELDMILKGNGQLTVQITDPIKFYTTIGAQKVGADNDGVVKITEDGILSSLKSAIIDKVAEAISALGSEENISYTALRSKTSRIAELINVNLSNEWAGKRGFEVASFSINGSFIPSDEDLKALRTHQDRINLAQSTTLLNYDIQKTVAEGVKEAGKNGGANGLFGIGLATSQMGTGIGGLGNIQPDARPSARQQAAGIVAPVAANLWACGCGAHNEGKFCAQCGSKKPDDLGVQEAATKWNCSCGAQNAPESRFCPECGAKKPAVRKLVCDKCGWTPTDGQKVKFCPECGDIFDDADYVEA